RPKGRSKRSAIYTQRSNAGSPPSKRASRISLTCWSIRRAGPASIGWPMPDATQQRPFCMPMWQRVVTAPAFWSLIVLVVLLMLLEGAVRADLVSSAVVASPSAALLGIVDLQQKVDILGALRSTLSTTLVAVALELIVAVPLGHLMYKRRAFSIAYTGWFAALSAAPIFLLYPLFLVIFGRNLVTLIVMGFL